VWSALGIVFVISFVVWATVVPELVTWAAVCISAASWNVTVPPSFVRANLSVEVRAASVVHTYITLVPVYWMVRAAVEESNSSNGFTEKAAENDGDNEVHHDVS